MAFNPRADLVVNDVYSNGVWWPGGQGVFNAEAGAWAGGSVKIQYQPGLTQTYFDTNPASTISANGSVQFILPPGMIKVVKTGSPTGVYACAGVTLSIT